MILDKGLVIDAYVRVSLIGIEILAIEARVVIASVDTYLRFAEAVERLGVVGDAAGRAAAVTETGDRPGLADGRHRVTDTTATVGVTDTTAGVTAISATTAHQQDGGRW